MSNGDKTAVVNGADSIWQLDDHPGTLYWTCPLAVDADGSPHAYHPPTPTAPSGSPPGLDYLANAGSPGNWWGIACGSSGDPYIQKSTDIAPGSPVPESAGRWRQANCRPRPTSSSVTEAATTRPHTRCRNLTGRNFHH
jgi:hypothetical protein